MSVGRFITMASIAAERGLDPKTQMKSCSMAWQGKCANGPGAKA